MRAWNEEGEFRTVKEEVGTYSVTKIFVGKIFAGKKFIRYLWAGLVQMVRATETEKEKIKGIKGNSIL